MVGTITCEVDTIMCDIGTINVKFYLLKVRYPRGYRRITPPMNSPIKKSCAFIKCETRNNRLNSAPRIRV
jgi:hypothetical protein